MSFFFNTISSSRNKSFITDGEISYDYKDVNKKITIEEIGMNAIYLLSDLSAGVTGEIVHVDCGYHVVGMKAVDAPDISVV